MLAAPAFVELLADSRSSEYEMRSRRPESRNLGPINDMDSECRLCPLRDIRTASYLRSESPENEVRWIRGVDRNSASKLAFLDGRWSIRGQVDVTLLM